MRRAISQGARTASHRTRLVLAIRRNPGTTLRGKHPPFTACFHNQQYPSQCEELATCETVFGRPSLSRTPLEGKCQYGHVALGAAGQVLHSPGDGSHDITETDAFSVKI